MAGGPDLPFVAVAYDERTTAGGVPEDEAVCAVGVDEGIADVIRL